MFQLRQNKKGKLCIITDNAEIADLVHQEQSQVAGPLIPVWFTGAPSREVADSIAAGMNEEFEGSNFQAAKNTGSGKTYWYVR